MDATGHGSRENRIRSFVDAHGVTVHYRTWASPAARGIVQIAHGLGEYADRYAWLAGELNRAGWLVVADDHRGHGRTGLGQFDGDHSRLGRLGPGGLRAATEDIHTLTGILAAEHALPVVLLGHSWGSLMTQRILNTHSTDYAAAVLTGTAYRMPGSMETGDLNKHHKHLGTTGYEWLSRDPDVVSAAAADPLMFAAKPLRLFGLADALRLFGRPGRDIRPDLPILIQAGSEDSLGGEASVRRLAASYRRRSGLSDVEVIVYPEARHEVFNETNRRQVVADLLSWLDSRVRRRESAE